MERFRIDGITKLNTFEDATKIPNNVVTKLENMVLDSTGAKAIRRGALKNSTYGVANSTGSIVSLFSAIINNVSYLIAKVGSILRIHNGSAWSTLSGTYLTSSSKIRVQPFLNKLYLTNGDDKPQYSDLTTLIDLEIARPDVRDINNYHNGGGNLTSSARYRYLLVYRTDLGEESEPSLPFSHYFYGTSGDYFSTDITYKTLKFILPISSDPRVTSKDIYRTKANAEDFYFNSNIDNNTQTWVDGKADTDLITSRQPKYTRIPLTADAIVSHDNRIIFGAITNEKKSINAPNEFVKASTTIGGNIGGYTWTPVTNSGGSGLTAGIYQWGITFIDENGIESDIVYSDTGTIASSNTELFNFQNFPTYMYMDTVVSCKIYRTKVNGSTYYLHQSLTDNWNANPDPFFNTLTDSYSDFTLGAAYSTSTNTYESAIAVSELGQPANIPALNLIQIFPDDGDKIVNIFDEEDGIMVFKQNSICKVYTRGSLYNWRVVKLIAKLGSDKWDSIQKVNRSYYFSYKNHIYRYPDMIVQPLSLPIQDNVETYLPTLLDTAFSSNFRWYIILCSDASYSSVIFIYDEIVNSWYKFTLPLLLNTVTEILNATDLIFGSGDNTATIIYDKSSILDYTNTSKDTTRITAKIKSKIFETPINRKSIRLMKMLSKYTKDSGYNVDQYIDSDGLTARFTDSTNNGIVYNELPTGKITSGTKLTHVKNLQYRIEGNGLQEFNNTEIEYFLTRRRIVIEPVAIVMTDRIVV